MEIAGEYFLCGAETGKTQETRNALEGIGFKKISSGIGYAVSPGDIADAVTVAYFAIQSVNGGDIVGAALQVLDLLCGWAGSEGRPRDVRRCDVTFKNSQNGNEVSISGFEYRTTEELTSLLASLRS